MSKIISFLIFIGLFVQSFQKDLKIYIYDPTITASQSFVNDTSITIKCKVNTREKPCEWTPKVTFTFPKEIPKPYLQLKMADLGTSVSIVDQTMSICSLGDTIGLDVVMKVIWEQISKYMDLILKCPLAAGTHTVSSFDQSAMKIIFAVLPQNRPILFSIIVKVRIGKKIEEIFKYTEKVEVVEV